jgi:DNA invertase Pin-like site-specific DNA recombinase
MMIAVLGGLADVERDLLRTRTAEGRSRAQKRGQHMGPALETHRRTEGRSTAVAGAGRDPCELARSYGMGKSKISRLVA